MRRRAPAVLAVTAALLLAAPVAAHARSANIVDADVSLRLAPDASLIVKERLTFDYQGHFEGSYRDIPLRHGERMPVDDIHVSQGGQEYRPGGNTTLGSHDEPGVYGAVGIDTGARIVWHYDATDEKRTYTITYRVLDAAVAYDDVIDVFWAVWGDQWPFKLPHLTADLRDSALDQENPEYRVWGHPRSVEGRTVRGAGEASLVANNVLPHTLVEFRVTVPRTPGQDVSGARKGEGSGLPKILADEKDLDRQFNTTYAKAKRWVAHHSTPLALLLLLLSLLVIFVLRFFSREHSVSTPEYLPEPPDDATPALAYGLANEGGDSSNTVLATLLDLIERGYYDTKQATTEKEKLDLSVTKASKRPTKDLEPYEKQVLDFFDELIGDESVAFSEMKDRIPEHDSSWRSKWNNMTSALDEADEGHLAWDRDLRKWRFLLFLVMLAAFAFVVFAYANVERLWFLPTAIGVVTLLVILASGGSKLKRLSPDYRERSSKWQAFAHWTDDFPRLKDDPPATLELWKKILIYGVAFGTAERMIASGRIPAPVLESTDNNSWTYYAMANPHIGDSALAGSSFSSGFSSQVAPESSGGGGGFSGGGGGGASGGGGGGSW